MTRLQFARARRTRSLVVGTLVSAAVFVFAACSSDSSDDDDASGGAPTGGSAGAGTGGSVSGSSSGGTSGTGAGGTGTGGSAATGGRSGGTGGRGGTATGGDAGASSGSGGADSGGSAGVAGSGGSGGGGSSTCPETPPDDASACGSVGLACYYEDCTGDGRSVARCQAGAWDVTNATCGAPTCEADGCDPGDICVITSGGTVLVNCVANPCGTGPIDCDCVGCERCSVNGSVSSGIVVTCSP